MRFLITRLGSGHPQKTIQSPDGLNKAPTDNTKPQQTIQSPNRQYKAPTDNTKPRNIRQNPKKTIQRHEMLDKTIKY